jgi:hypothetical protein
MMSEQDNICDTIINDAVVSVRERFPYTDNELRKEMAIGPILEKASMDYALRRKFKVDNNEDLEKKLSRKRHTLDSITAAMGGTTGNRRKRAVEKNNSHRKLSPMTTSLLINPALRKPWTRLRLEEKRERLYEYVKRKAKGNNVLCKRLYAAVGRGLTEKKLTHKKDVVWSEEKTCLEKVPYLDANLDSNITIDE